MSYLYIVPPDKSLQATPIHDIASRRQDGVPFVCPEGLRGSAFAVRVIWSRPPSAVLLRRTGVPGF